MVYFHFSVSRLWDHCFRTPSASTGIINLLLSKKGKVSDGHLLAFLTSGVSGVWDGAVVMMDCPGAAADWDDLPGSWGLCTQQGGLKHRWRLSCDPSLWLAPSTAAELRKWRRNSSVQGFPHFGHILGKLESAGVSRLQSYGRKTKSTIET